MKKVDRKILEQKLYVAIEKVLVHDDAKFKNKTEAAIEKSIKKIAKKVSIKKIKHIQGSRIMAKVEQAEIDD